MSIIESTAPDRIDITDAGLVWLDQDNEIACLRNELAVAREEIVHLGMEKDAAHLLLAERTEDLLVARLELATIRRWIADK